MTGRETYAIKTEFIQANGLQFAVLTCGAGTRWRCVFMAFRRWLEVGANRCLFWLNWDTLYGRRINAAMG
jgi:hypothetical protein